jgi:hypothetical protein
MHPPPKEDLHAAWQCFVNNGNYKAQILAVEGEIVASWPVKFFVVLPTDG